MAEIAAAVREAVEHRRAAGTAGCTVARPLARGDGWSVADVLCSCGRHDRAFEEQHAEFAIAWVIAGTFRHRTHSGSCSLTPGAVMFGNAGDAFECSHEHGDGDRCVAFWYTPAFFEHLAADVGVHGRARFSRPGLPPIRETAGLAARASAGALDPGGASWEELALATAVRTLACARGGPDPLARTPSPADGARVLAVVRLVNDAPGDPWPLARLALTAELSTFHFLRTFEHVTGLTPHQFVRRARLRRAASALLTNSARIIDVALDAGFEEASSFTRAFRAEFGCSPRTFSAAYRHRRPSRLS